MTTDDAILRGAQFARDHLRIIESAYGPMVTMAYAGGMASGVRNSVGQKHGRRAAYDLMQGLADDLILPANAGEGEV